MKAMWSGGGGLKSSKPVSIGLGKMGSGAMRVVHGMPCRPHRNR